MGAMSEDAWSRLGRIERATLRELFASEPDRVERLAIEIGNDLYDFSKTHLSRGHIAGFLALAEETGLAARREEMFAGGIVNPTEGRAAEHSAERGQGAPASVARANGFHARMRAL